MLFVSCDMGCLIRKGSRIGAEVLSLVGVLFVGGSRGEHTRCCCKDGRMGEWVFDFPGTRRLTHYMEVPIRRAAEALYA